MEIPADVRTQEFVVERFSAFRRFFPAALKRSTTNLVLGSVFWLFAPDPVGAGEPDDKARSLADAVFKASGGDNWSKVKLIRFTFNVRHEGVTIVSAKHEWNLRSGTDTVSWGDKTVAVNVWNPADDADSKAAYQRWVNDSYWLLAPFKGL